MRSFELSESELQEKIEAARPAAVAAEAVHELRTLREQSGAEGGALAELRAARELIAARDKARDAEVKATRHARAATHPSRARRPAPPRPPARLTARPSASQRRL